MSKAVDSLYEQGTVNYKRLDTDTLFTDMAADCRFTGVVDKTIRFIEDFQLLDAENWTRFVNQFKQHTDVCNYGWRGEYWGKMMRGAAFTYAYTKNPELYKALTDTVEDMLTAEDELGRISTYSVDCEFRGWDLWCRKYVMLGMQYFMEVCTDEDLKARMTASMKRQADYLISKLGPRSEGKLPITSASTCWRGLNSSSILEPIVRLYDITGDAKYLNFASYIVGEGGTSVCNIFELAYQDKTDPYQYPVTKAYEMMSNFEGLLEYYRATGIEKHKETVIRFARRVINSDITIIGSAGCTHELFDHSAARQTDTAYSGIMQETCVTVTWMKFCWQLLSLTGDPIFADQFEQALYNAYIGAVNTEKIVDYDLIKRTFPDAKPEPLPFDSYSSLLPNTRGRGIGGLQLMPDNHYYGCCACIGSAGTGLISKVAVMLSREGAALNLYIPGTVATKTPSGKALNLDVATEYPADGRVEITVSPEAPEEFTLSLRIPGWSAATELSVNGEPVEVNAGYTAITRLWNPGDKVLLELDMRTKVIHAPRDPHDVLMTARSWGLDLSYPTVFEEAPDAKFHIAMRRGPLVLARDARLGENVDEPVDIKYDRDGYVDVKPSKTASFDTIVEYKVPQVHGGEFTVIDYSSAGKTWKEDSKYGCWLPTRRLGK
ncbi:MAG: beta-L-arabinofuranosidase domain-containing protein [Candidatus Flemingiibacterium sp.]